MVRECECTHNGVCRWGHVSVELWIMIIIIAAAITYLSWFNAFDIASTFTSIITIILFIM